MKSKEELNALKEEIEAVNKKLAELSEEELVQVSGGDVLPVIYFIKHVLEPTAIDPYDTKPGSCK